MGRTGSHPRRGRRDLVRRRGAGRALAVGLAVAGFLGAFVPTAGASEVRTDSHCQPGLGCLNRLIYGADPGEYNQVHFAAADNPPSLFWKEVVVKETYTRLEAGHGCHQLTPTSALCFVGIAQFETFGGAFIFLGDRDNLLTIDPSLELRADIRGGPGVDDMMVANGQVDSVRTCGEGRDSVTADRSDSVAGDCEVVRRL